MVYSCIVCFYSYLNNYLGYGDLFDPIVNMAINSSSINNILIVPFLYYLNLIYQKNSIALKIISLLNIFICITIGLYLKGRIFIFLLCINIFIISIIKLSPNKKIIFILIFALLFYNYEILIEPALLDRLGLGVSSNRFLHYENFFINFHNFPFGGMPINTDIEETRWFHNIFFDTYKISGFLPTLLLLLYLLFTFYVLYKNIKSNGFTFYSIIILNIFIIFQIDVIIEGSILLLFIFFTLSILLTQEKNCKLIGYKYLK
jgi:hypothetical protein